MKRFSSLILLILILFNTIGYYGFLAIVKEHESDRAIRKINESQNEPGGNMLVRIPLNQPYGHDDAQYEPASGELDYEGEVYHVLKQRFYHDTLYIVYLHDQKGTEVKKAMDEVSLTFADQNQKSDTHGKNVVSFAKFYTVNSLVCYSAYEGWPLDTPLPVYGNDYSFAGRTSIFHPPC